MYHFLFSSKTMKIGYHDVQQLLHNTNYYIINTLPPNEQGCLIKNTLSTIEEPQVINECISKYNFKKSIIVYGKNCSDSSADTKAEQLIKLGFKNVYLYGGGLFEWLLLQDIYGNDLFPTIGNTDDILKYKAPRLIT